VKKAQTSNALPTEIFFTIPMDIMITSLRDNVTNSTFLLRAIMAVILLTHSVPSMMSDGVTTFGNVYLNQIGFAPFGLYLAWLIKLSQALSGILLLVNRYHLFTVVSNVFILGMGIILVHARDGWFVIGSGRNGAEFNVVLICILLAILFPQGLRFPPYRDNKKNDDDH
jgi:putative oxidoreductase